MRVITFSRFFPVKHPRKGEPTFFMEKIWKKLNTGNRLDGEYTVWSKYPRLMKAGYWQLPHLWRDQMNDKDFAPKYHTIRAGNRWKVGDKFSPRVWSGLPYRSKQIEFAPPIEIKKVFEFEKDGKGFYFINGNNHGFDIEKVANNDGLTMESFDAWFYFVGNSKNGFKGQIICWNESIEY